MERSWWWKAALYGAVVVLSCLYLVPSVVPQEKQPAIIQKLFHKRIQKGLDLAGVLRLVSNVTIDQVDSTKVDQMANAFQDNLHKQVPDVHVGREGRDEIVFTFKNPADVSKLNNDTLAEYRDDLDAVAKDE